MASTSAAARSVRVLAVEPTVDRTLLRDFLERDRLYAAYAICDLDEREFGRTRWGVAREAGEAIAVVLEYGGYAPQPVFVMGDTAGIAAILREVIRPKAAYLAGLPEHLPALEGLYTFEAGAPMVRMWVDRPSFRPYPGEVRRILPIEAGDLNRLYQLGFTAWLPSTALTEGVYYGVWVSGRLVAAAGTHVISREARLAAVGNVLTHVDYRGRGYATAVTGAVTAELLRTCDQVVLNVRSDNPPALAAYRRLGYREHIRFEERLVQRVRQEGSLAGLSATFRRLLGRGG
jgi:RimJ/RimL family protein N-acetyltransferase